MFIRLNKRAQGSLEYTIIITIVVAAFLLMQVYYKRSIQGRWRSSADDIGDQYSPGVTTGTSISNRTGSSTEIVNAGSLSSAVSSNSDTNITDNVPIAANEIWSW